MTKLQGSHVLITGASSGIGRGLAIELGRRGAKVSLLARRVDRLEELAREMEASGAEAVAVPCDVGELQSVEEAVTRAEEVLGTVDIAIANAGVGTPTPAHRQSAAAAAQIMRVNLEGASNLIFTVLPAMVARKQGHVVGIASLAGYRGVPGSTAYSASKAGLKCLLDGLQAEVGQQGVIVTDISPGFVKSEMTDKNKFPMPFKWATEKAAADICDTIERGSLNRSFPFPLAPAMRLIGVLPGWIYRLIMRRVAKVMR